MRGGGLSESGTKGLTSLPCAPVIGKHGTDWSLENCCCSVVQQQYSNKCWRTTIYCVLYICDFVFCVPTMFFATE